MANSKCNAGTTKIDNEAQFWPVSWPVKLHFGQRRLVWNIGHTFALHVVVIFFQLVMKVVLTFNSVDETLVCDHSNESYWAALSSGTVYYAVQWGSNFYICKMKPKLHVSAQALLHAFSSSAKTSS